jgi:hypothetical protein
MRGKGINYDTGFHPGGHDSRPDFDPDIVRCEMLVIAEELHCTAVRISGADPERLSVAARHAAAAGLEIWFAPFPCELGPKELLALFADCAGRAEEVRLTGAEVVLVLGCEMTLFTKGFIPGDTAYERIAMMSSGSLKFWISFARIASKLNAFLAEAVAAARERFGGRITYASGTWEKVDWRPFDIVSVDAYRDANNAKKFRKELRTNGFGHGKPVAVTEFGCCTYEGASDRGGMGWAILEEGADPPRLKGDYRRSEQEQVDYLRELLEIFEQEGVDTVFWFTFATYMATHRADQPRFDLDMGAYGVVKMLPEGADSARPGFAWEPKEVFHALADAYRG